MLEYGVPRQCPRGRNPRYPARQTRNIAVSAFVCLTLDLLADNRCTLCRQMRTAHVIESNGLLMHLFAKDFSRISKFESHRPLRRCRFLANLIDILCKIPQTSKRVVRHAVFITTHHDSTALSLSTMILRGKHVELPSEQIMASYQIFFESFREALTSRCESLRWMQTATKGDQPIANPACFSSSTLIRHTIQQFKITTVLIANDSMDTSLSTPQ